ncbi:protease inhibitor I42 family protein [Planctomycetota bacterium]
MKRILISITVFCLILFTGCMYRQNKSAQAGGLSASMIETTVGDNFTIQLDSNPTTGYSWRLAGTLPDMLELVGSDFVMAENKENIVGAGGVEHWTFKAIREGETTLTFEYIRPWEQDEPPAKEDTYTIMSK